MQHGAGTIDRHMRPFGGRWGPVLLALLAWCTSGWSQTPAFRHFMGRDGLPQSQVRALLEDRHGFLWVGTHGGVARLGASGFRTFGLEQGLGAGRVRALLEDVEGGIWVAQADASLGLIRGGRIRSFGPAEGLETSHCFALALDGGNRVLVGTRMGLFRWDGGRFQRVPLPTTWGQAPVLALLRDRGDLWIGGRAGQVARGSGGTWTETPLPTPAEDLLDLRLSPQGEPWAMTATRLLRFSVGRWERVDLPGCPPGARLQAFRFDGERGLLVALGEEGLWLRDGEGRTSRWTSREGLPQEQINLAYRDRGGVLWIGTNGEGLLAQALPGLGQITGEGPLALGPVLHILELDPRTFLLGSERGLFRWEEGRGITRRWTTADGLPGNQSWAAVATGPGSAWVGTAKGLVRIRNGRLERRIFLPGQTINHLLAFRGRILAATDQGLWELDGEGRVLARAHLPADLGVDGVIVLAAVRGEILAGSPVGLFRYRGGALERVHEGAPFAHQRIICLLDGPGGRLWVGTVRGLFRESDEGWESLGPREGLSSAHTYFLGDAGGGRVAVGHGHGVTLLEPDGRAVGLNERFGLLSDETNRGAFLRDSRGRQWWGMTTGVNLFGPSATPRTPPTPAPAILEAAWRGGGAFLPRALDLPPGTNELRIDFDMGQAISPAPPHVEVYLEGHESGWQPLGTSQGVNYGALRPGHYTFRLRGSLDGLAWSEARPLPIEVRPAWHQRMATRILGLVLLVGLIGLLIRWRVHWLKLRARSLEAVVHQRTLALAQRNKDLESVQAQLHRVLEGRERLMRGLAHDLRSPLAGMLLMADRLEDEDRLSERKRLLDLFRREGGRIDAMAARLLDEARTQANLLAPNLVRVSPHEVFQGMDELLALRAQDRDLRFRFEEEPCVASAQVKADPLALQQVLLNLAGNAMKFTPAGGVVSVRSALLPTESAWMLEVQDTGRGLDADQLDRLRKPFEQEYGSDAAEGWGLGLSIVALAAEAHRGRLAVDSRPGEGATFRFILPLAEPAP